mgnify:CR=1 FL=1
MVMAIQHLDLHFDVIQPLNEAYHRVQDQPTENANSIINTLVARHYEF